MKIIQEPKRRHLSVLSRFEPSACTIRSIGFEFELLLWLGSRGNHLIESMRVCAATDSLLNRQSCCDDRVTWSVI